MFLYVLLSNERLYGIYDNSKDTLREAEVQIKDLKAKGLPDEDFQLAIPHFNQLIQPDTPVISIIHDADGHVDPTPREKLVDIATTVEELVNATTTVALPAVNFNTDLVIDVQNAISEAMKTKQASYEIKPDSIPVTFRPTKYAHQVVITHFNGYDCHTTIKA